jgi:hypothetical protein
MKAQYKTAMWGLIKFIENTTFAKNFTHKSVYPLLTSARLAREGKPGYGEGRGGGGARFSRTLCWVFWGVASGGDVTYVRTWSNYVVVKLPGQSHVCITLISCRLFRAGTREETKQKLANKGGSTTMCKKRKERMKDAEPQGGARYRTKGAGGGRGQRVGQTEGRGKVQTVVTLCRWYVPMATRETRRWERVE